MNPSFGRWKTTVQRVVRRPNGFTVETTVQRSNGNAVVPLPDVSSTQHPGGNWNFERGRGVGGGDTQPCPLEAGGVAAACNGPLRPAPSTRKVELQGRAPDSQNQAQELYVVHRNQCFPAAAQCWVCQRRSTPGWPCVDPGPFYRDFPSTPGL
eukprot:gene8421-biopygen19637